MGGVLAHVDHIADLGVDYVWLNPVFPSPGLDHGYDVSDYTTIADEMGGMPAFEALRDALHDNGIRLVMDVVPGHTSSAHPWFVSARRGRDAPHRDFFVWRDPAPDGGPPTNWESVFGGSAWEYDERSGQYWMHRFLPDQPDLDWRNPAVRAAFDDILSLWFERGLDGFRVDVAQGLLADPEWADVPDVPPDMPRAQGNDLRLSGFMGRPETPALYRSWRRIADRHDALLLGEVALSSPEAVAAYLSDDLLHRAFFLPLQHTGWNRDEIAEMLVGAVAAGGGRFAWPQSSHDDPRAATRFGGGATGTRRALAFLHLVATLPGNPVILAGDELGLENGLIPAGLAQDPVSGRGETLVASRDGSRTPMPWDAERPNMGFTTGTPWLPLGANRAAADTVAHQRDDPGSPLQRTRRLLETRRGLTGMLATDDVTWLDLGPDLLGLRRGDVVVVCNFGPSTTVDVGRCRLLVASSDDAVVDDRDGVSIGRDTTVLLRAAEAVTSP
nr:alpha-amylase family glycosyl hydrolase [Salsipaludibacter albus]